MISIDSNLQFNIHFKIKFDIKLHLISLFSCIFMSVCIIRDDSGIR